MFDEYIGVTVSEIAIPMDKCIEYFSEIESLKIHQKVLKDFKKCFSR